MGKNLLCVIFAVIALQSCSAAFVNSYNDLEEAVALFAKASRELEHVEEFINKHIATMAREFDFKIQTILEEKQIYPVIEELRNNISQIEAGISNPDSTHCAAEAWTWMVPVTEEVKRGIDNCISEAHLTEANLKIIAQSVDRKAIALRDQLTFGYSTCMNNEETSDAEKVTCLHSVIDPALPQIQALDEEVKKSHHDAHKLFEDGVRNLQICLQHVKQDIKSKSETIIGNLQECIQSQASTLLGRATRGIIDFFRELREKIESIIHLASHLPHGIDEIQDSINQIIAHINISFLISQLKSEVNDVIKQGGRNAESCRPDADKKIDDLLLSSEEDANICMAETEARIDAIEAQIKAVVSDAKALLAELNKTVWNCSWSNILNPIGFAKCLEGKYDDFKQKVSDLQDRANDTVDQSKAQAKDIIQEFSKCMSAVQLNLIKTGQTIIAETEECVRFA